ncbi:hypothetical protein BB559_004167 [Furculomyces boomerangus]|uniref:Uncharacterized protein n=2 Tax=Harpellales TaxID=61421 RepID=A0A2T9YGA4_9FUNG|nr:hypothetical protein BB559_004167 [Furculomyces boomerangus]PVZ97647.1 hypothetical protein BB558_006387 [Smittium angustum]
MVKISNQAGNENIKFSKPKTNNLKKRNQTQVLGLGPIRKSLNSRNKLPVVAQVRQQQKQLVTSSGVLRQKPVIISEPLQRYNNIMVTGISRQKIKDLKNTLVNLRFNIKKIFNISFVEDKTEFIIARDYRNTFFYKISLMEGITVVGNN